LAAFRGIGLRHEAGLLKYSDVRRERVHRSISQHLRDLQLTVERVPPGSVGPGTAWGEAPSRERLDQGFLRPPIPPDSLDLQELTRQPFVAVLSATLAVARKKGRSGLAESFHQFVVDTLAVKVSSFE
jgi:hypothetical protein